MLAAARIPARPSKRELSAHLTLLYEAMSVSFVSRSRRCKASKSARSRWSRRSAAVALLLCASAGSSGAASASSSGLHLPSFFVPNRYGGPDAACFVAWSPSLSARLFPDRIVFRTGGERFEMRLAGANRRVPLIGEQPLAARLHSFSGASGPAAQPGSPLFSAVRYPGLYPGIDLLFSTDSSQFKHQFVVAPHARPQRILLQYSGASLSVDRDGGLVIRAGRFEGREPPPLVFQVVDGTSRIVPASFRLGANGDVRFKLAAYDPDLPLIIDPVLTYSAVMGGGHDNAATAIASDPSGNVYVAGWTDSADFPLANPFQPAFGGEIDAFVLKLNPSGNALLYATFLGGSQDDLAFGIAVDASGEATVTGWTQSPNFPVASASQSSLRGGAGQDAFVTKLSSAGDALIFSTYLGGSGTDSGYAVAVSPLGNVYVTGDTQSSDFPTYLPAQSAYAGAQDAFVTVYSPSGVVAYSSYLGGNGQDHAAAIAVDSSANMIVAGSTYSTNFPVAFPVQSHNAGGEDAFAVKLSPTGALLFGTYLGGSLGSPSLPEGRLRAPQSMPWVTSIWRAPLRRKTSPRSTLSSRPTLTEPTCLSLNWTP